MRTMSFAIAALLALASASGAATSDAVNAFKKAMSSDDSTAKRDALKALSSKGAGGSEEEVLPLLISAVSDRQAGDAAIDALRARTGLHPAANRGQSHYPNYPSGDSAGDWSTWLSERTREKEQEAKVKEAEKTAKEAKKLADKGAKKDGDDKTDADGKTKPDGDKTAKGDADGDADAKPKHAESALPPEDLGKLDRIIFKNGSNLVCYILTRRSDADGNLLSVRIVHPDGSGEETLSASMIARIEDDIR